MPEQKDEIGKVQPCQQLGSLQILFEGRIQFFSTEIVGFPLQQGNGNIPEIPLQRHGPGNFPGVDLILETFCVGRNHNPFIGIQAEIIHDGNQIPLGLSRSRTGFKGQDGPVIQCLGHTKGIFQLGVPELEARSPLCQSLKKRLAPLFRNRPPIFLIPSQRRGKPRLFQKRHPVCRVVPCNGRKESAPVLLIMLHQVNHDVTKKGVAHFQIMAQRC